VAVIASKESRDVVHNIEVLDGIASVPAPISYTMKPQRPRQQITEH
jgi:hypothetical protein